jgi:hypothetical protein
MSTAVVPQRALPSPSVAGFDSPAVRHPNPSLESLRAIMESLDDEERDYAENGPGDDDDG